MFKLKEKPKLSQREILREVFSTRIDAFAATVLPHYFTIPFSPLHRYLFNTFRYKIGTDAREAIAAPRGLRKTTVTTLASHLRKKRE